MNQSSVTYIHKHQAEERRKAETPGLDPDPWMTYDELSAHLKRPMRATYTWVWRNKVEKHYPFHDDKPYFKRSEIEIPKLGRPKGT